VDELDLSSRRKALTELTKIVLGWPTWQGVRSYWALEQMAGAMSDQYKADGFLLAPTRSCETDFRNGYIAMQRIFKDRLPTIEYDTETVDVRKMDIPGSKRKTELFVELMKAHREKKGGA
jgi:hypothetical protein